MEIDARKMSLTKNAQTLLEARCRADACWRNTFDLEIYSTVNRGKERLVERKQAQEN